MRVLVVVLLLADLCSLDSTARTQESTVAGTWLVQSEAARGETDSGGSWSLSAGSGTLTLEAQGNQLRGTWHGPIGPPWPITGRVAGETFEAQTEFRDIPARKNNRNTTSSVRWGFRGTRSGDTLAGYMTLQSEDGDARSQPFRASRKRK